VLTLELPLTRPVLLQAQFDVLVNKNPDVNYVTEMLRVAIRNHGINEDRVYVFGSGMGGDLAYRVACENSDIVTAVILHDASPFPDERNFCQPKVRHLSAAGLSCRVLGAWLCTGFVPHWRSPDSAHCQRG
jgi:dienelactone hydrolase